MLLTVSRDLSTDKQQRGIEALNNSMLSDKSQKKKFFITYSEMGLHGQF